MIDKFKESFKEEAFELLAELESALMDLEKDKTDKELIDKIFRIVHTIKGTSAMFGLEEVSGFAHRAENLLELLRSRKLEVTTELIDLIFIIKDCIADMIQQTYNGNPANLQNINEILLRMDEFMPEQEDQDTENEFPCGKTSNKEFLEKMIILPELTTYRIRFHPPRDIFLKGLNPCVLLAQLIKLGKYKAVAYMNEIPELTEIDPEICYCRWDILLTTNQGINAIKDIFIFVENESILEIDIIDKIDNTDLEAEYKKLGEILLDKGDISSDDLNKVLVSKKRIGEILVEQKITGKSEIEAALLEQEYIRESRKRQQTDTMITSIKVKSGKLDKLFNLVGELVAIKARLTQTANVKNDTDFVRISEDVERITDELYNTTMNIRMLPIGTTFEKFRRVVRDISKELGKEVELYTEGSTTELDKTVIEKLNDPLVHLIRNSIDHGIELPVVRIQKSKNQKGILKLKATHSGADIIIEISDDGAGIDKDKIIQTASEKNLISDNDSLSDKEIYDLIFKPGFSTLSQVSTLSGRGVGMDVVKKAIDSLGGTISIQSKKNEGTTITLRIPLTLSIIDGLLILIGDQYYVLPLQIVQECIELSDENNHSENREMINLRGEALPYIRLKDYFQIPHHKSGIEMIVIVRAANTNIGLVVDQVIGEHQIVIKSLGRMYQSLEGILGATILGDGTVALILDVNSIIQEAIADKCIK